MVAGLLLIAGGVFLVFVGCLDATEFAIYGVPYSLLRKLGDHYFRGHIVGVLLEIHMKLFLLTIAGGLFAIAGGVLVIAGKVSRGKGLAHYAELGFCTLFPPLIFYHLEPELEELLRMIPEVGYVDLETLSLTYFFTWGVIIMLEIARWLAREPPVAPIQIVQVVSAPKVTKKYCIKCGTELSAGDIYCPNCGTKQ